MRSRPARAVAVRLGRSAVPPAYDGVVGADVSLRVPAYRVDPRARWLWGLENAARTAILAAIVLTVVFLLPANLPGRWDTVVAIAPWLLLPYAVIVIGVEPVWRYRVHRWEVTGDAVYTRVGWVVRTWQIVPIARIQTVDTARGPLQQILGLGSITIRTASAAGSTEIEQLSARIADQVAHDLALRANAVPDDAT